MTGQLSIIFNAGVPRSGTVLVNAILRRLLEDVEPELLQTNPHGAELAWLFEELPARGLVGKRTVLVHTHSWNHAVPALLAPLGPVGGVITYRDPRDVCVSLMGLHDLPLDEAMAHVDQAFQSFEAILATLDLTVIAYEDLLADRPAHIARIGEAIGRPPSPDRIAEIDAATSLAAHRTVMEQVAAGTLPGLSARPNRYRTLVEDRDTLINDRHIQSGAVGRWRTELSADDQETVNRRFADVIERHGYG